MLGYWRHHEEFKNFPAEELRKRWPVHQQSILSYESAIEKAWLLDLDELLPVLKTYYSPIGRPSAPVPEILRSLALMVHFKEESIDT